MNALPATDARDSEIAALRSRVTELEAELREKDARTTSLVAEAQEKLYWLERWQVDLDAAMARPGAVPALNALKWVRGHVRSLRRLKRRLLAG